MKNFHGKSYQKKNIGLWPLIDKKKLIKFRNKKCNRFKENKFLNNLFKIGYSMYSDKINKNKQYIFITKAFQRRFRPVLINGKIDLECLLISEKLNKLKF